VTRVIAGRWGGRRLRTPPGDGTRPTSDRVRESLFSSLQSLFGGLDGVRVLDVYAGSGALALEALSRGAASADLVESDRRAAQVAQQNARELGAEAIVHRTSAASFAAAATGPYDLVMLDPPYAVATDDVAAVVAALAPSLADDAVVVVERSTRTPFTWPAGFEGFRDRAHGETTVWFGARSDES
jgi:16S rRNA (guanine966-N2)-methyltransferase